MAHSRCTNPAPSRWRTQIASGLRPAVALASVGALVAAVYFVSQPRFALADVIRAFSQVETAYWTQTHTTYDRHGNVSTIHRNENWVRLGNDPAWASHTLPPQFFIPDSGGSQPEQHTLMTTRQNITSGFPPGHYFVSPGGFKIYPPHGKPYFTAQSPAELNDFICHKLFVDADLADPSNGPKWSRETPNVAIEIAQPRVISVGGNQWVEFRQQVRSLPSGAVNCVNLIWADPQTRLLVRGESINFDETTGQVRDRIVREGFRYNMTLAREVFQLPPPPGAQIHQQELGDWMEEKSHHAHHEPPAHPEEEDDSDAPASR